MHILFPFMMAALLVSPVFSGAAQAACAAPVGNAGSLNYIDGTRTLNVCDGTNWKLLEEVDAASAGARLRAQIANDTGSCNNSKTGRLRYNGTATWEYCNGSTWVPFQRAAGKAGYLVQTSATFNGNLGGLAGADAKCLTDLTNNNWKGKAQITSLTADRVRAFLCNGTICNNLVPDSSYILATSGNAAMGGSGFITDSQGRGFGHQFYNDSGSALWRSAENFWSNRGTLSDEIWSPSPASASNNYHCSNWTSTGTNGHKGNTSGNGQRYRWDDGTVSCATSLSLICIVEAQAPPCTLNIGNICENGSIYAGRSPDGDTDMFTTPADAGMFSWNKGTAAVPATGIGNCTTGAQTSCTTGKANTETLAALSDTASPYRAAKYCADLIAHGYDDWYLPARNELDVLYTNRALIGGFETGVGAEWYWSSSPNTTSYTWHQSMNNGAVDGSGVRNGVLYVRCVRK